MENVQRVWHDEMCCDVERPHVHVAEDPAGTASFRLGRAEWRGVELDVVLAAVDHDLPLIGRANDPSD